MIKSHFQKKSLFKKDHLLPIERARLGVLGGSGFYSVDKIENLKEINITTPYGKPSDSLKIGNIGSIEIVFLARHGENHTLNPTEIPYKANIWAMKSLGVKWLLSPSAVGSLQEQIRPLDLVVPDQFIDRTYHRPATFFSDGAVAHVSMANPFCSNLSKIIIETGKDLLPEGRELHENGTYLAMEGPAFSTKAESNLYHSWGCSIIGMTNHTEARLAREAEIAYSSLCMVTDYDCWNQKQNPVSVSLILENLRINTSIAKKIIYETAKAIDKIRPESLAHESLKDGLITNKKFIPDKIKDKIKIFTEKYWG
tara:strand:+ start:4579 stop:5511 length:933 start_codon:yes stop_codon:yes gene_type:complete